MNSQYLSSYQQHKRTVEAGNYLYEKIIDAPINPPLLQSTLLQHLRIDSLQEQTTYIDLIIASVSEIFEKYTNVNIIKQKWRTYRNNFDVGSFELRKAPFVSLQTFQKLIENVWTEIDEDIYTISLRSDYAQILPSNSTTLWGNEEVDNVDNAIKIEFTAGIADNQSQVPANLKLHLLNHCAWLYENRGNSLMNEKFDLSVYDQWKIFDLFGGFSNTI